MKICILTHNLIPDNGAGVFSRRLVVGLRTDFNDEVDIITAAPSGFSGEYPFLSGGVFSYFLNFFRIRKIFRRCDVIHALDGFPYGVVAYIFSLGLGKKIFITAIGSGSIIPLHKLPHRPLLSLAYREANKVSAISNFTKREIQKVVPHLEIDVLTHGVDLEEFQVGDKKTLMSAKAHQPYLLSVGALRWRKGYKFSLKGFAEIVKEIPELNYVIVGKKYSENYAESLKQLAVELGIRDKVFFLDSIENREELREVYRNAELFCLLSQNADHDVEGFGLVFLEAAAAGLPVVGSRDCGIEDAVQDGKNGTLVPPRDILAFRDAAVSILRNPEKKRSMQRVSLQFAEHSTWKKKIASYHHIYENLIAAA